MMIELTNILEHKFLEPENCGDCTDRPPGEHVLGMVIGQRYSGLTTNRTAWENNFSFTFDRRSYIFMDFSYHFLWIINMI